MFITLKYNGYREYIPITSILKFVKNDDQDIYKMILSESFSPRDFTMKNVVLLISQQSQPIAFLQIQEYLKPKNY
jgi:hypothetical protein